MSRTRRHAHRVMTASTTTVRSTPPELYDWIDGQLHFTVDVCATEANAKHPRFFSPEDNGLAQDWSGETFWMNPPYGREILGWMRKARDEAMLNQALGCALVPARVDTDWWRSTVMQADGEAGRLRLTTWHAKSEVLWMRWEHLTVGVHFYDTRIKFDDMETGAPFPAAFVFLSSTRRRPVDPRLLSTLPGNRSWRLLVEGWPL